MIIWQFQSWFSLSSILTANKRFISSMGLICSVPYFYGLLHCCLAIVKVETIGDAYMVVSGLTQPYTDKHAAEISRMALALGDVIKSFQIAHMPQERLKLRTGIHSGGPHWICSYYDKEAYWICNFYDKKMEMLTCAIFKNASDASALLVVHHFTILFRSSVRRCGRQKDAQVLLVWRHRQHHHYHPSARWT